jgi:hypothetical protein
MESTSGEASKKRGFSEISLVPHEKLQAGPDPRAFYFGKSVSQRNEIQVSEQTQAVKTIRSNGSARTTSTSEFFSGLLSPPPTVSPGTLVSPKIARETAIYSKEEWLSRKDLIHRLWVVEKKKFKNVKRPRDSIQEILKRDYDFHITLVFPEISFIFVA